MSKQNIKLELFNQLARIAKALSNPNRLHLVELLAQGERGVDALATVAGLSTANTSQHLQQLKLAGLVSTRKEGLNVFYQLSGDDVLRLFMSIRNVAEEHLGDVDKLVSGLLGPKDDLAPMAAGELLAKVQSGEVLVLDVRPVEEYSAGHVPHAINVSLAMLEATLESLPKNQQVVAYCRGPHCIMAFEAVEKMRELGFNACRMEAGFPEWKLAGLPVELSKPVAR